MIPTQLDDFKPPSRRPWLLIGAVLILIGLGIQGRRMSCRSWFRKTPQPEGVSERVTDPVTPVAPTAVVSRDPKSVPTKEVSLPGRRTGKSPIYDNARELDARGELGKARELYLNALADPGLIASWPQIEQRLGEINVRLLLTPISMPEKVDYVVQRGDSIARIAKRHGTTMELVTAQNQLKTNMVLKVGERLKVLKAPFSIEVSKGSNELVVRLDGRFFKRYPVATGKDNKTPMGTFVVTDRIKEPTWWKDNKPIAYGHPDNILGTRWLAIKATGNTPDVKGYGIHGTWDNASIGTAASAGCVRMRNPDVEEVFTLIPIGTAVTITD